MARPGEESVRNETGKQIVWPTATRNGMTDLCAHHKRLAEGYAQVEKKVGDMLGLETHAPESMDPHHGSCAECTRRAKPGELANSLDLLMPPGYKRKLDQSERTPRKPFAPGVTRTKSFEPLRQSENAAQRHLGEVATYYHGTANEPPENEHGYHVIPAGVQMHADPKVAWHEAIKHWNDDESTAFPRVYRAHFNDDELKAHNQRPGGGLHLTSPAEAQEFQHDHEQHPPIKLEHEEGPILYHGTSHFHEPDDEDLEAHTPHEDVVAGGTATHGHLTRSDSHAYATPNLKHAWYYANDRALNIGGTPHVYRVTPKNPHDVEKDPMEDAAGNSRGNYEHDKRSPTGFDVLDEVPPTRRQHAQFKDEHAQEHGLGEYANEDDDEGAHHWGSRHEPFEHAPGDTCSLCDNDWPTAKDLEKDAMTRKIAHDSGDSQRIFHCPFCGAGQVIGRSDGTTECEFCQAHFTVQVQPQFNSFPQTINGQPVQIPGMPGQNDALMGDMMPPGGAPGAPGEPGNADPTQDPDNPFAGAGDAPGGAQGDSGDEAADGDDDKPDFLKSKSYRTATGAQLNEDQFIRYLALIHAPDHGKMAEHLRRSRQ